MNHLRTLPILCALLLAASCGRGSHSSAEKPAANPAAQAVPAAVEQAAENLLGSETDVLAFGDLAKNGRQEALFVNRLKTTPKGMAPGTLVTRAAVIENDGGTWKEVFLCDEHLKNQNGFLGGTPIAPVTGWRLQYEQDPKKGLDMYFTPLERPAGGYIETVEVRWNPEVKRYQSLDRSFEHFVGEISSLDPVEMNLRR